MKKEKRIKVNKLVGRAKHSILIGERYEKEKKQQRPV